ncbi:DUF2953 domain-containing protein [Paenibacillus paeoniae]|nr:DUF2953 domain-containing protein [Paenibacillus paeoniae]
MLGHPFGWIWAGGFFVLFALIVLLASPVVVSGFVRRIGNNDDAELSVKALFGLIRYRYKVPFMSMNGMSLKVDEQVSKSSAGINSWKEYNDEIDSDKVVSAIEKYKHILHLTRDLKGWVRDTLTRVDLTDWRWSTTVGTGDAMWTAMATGAVWSVKTGIIGLLSQMVHVKNGPIMEVNPDFQRSSFKTEWSCVAQIRFGYAILAALQLLARMKKWKKGAKTWKNILFRA